MSITRLNPNTIYLGGPRTEIGDLTAKAAVCPGALVERVNTAGVQQFQNHSTAGGAGQRLVATEQSMLNKGINDGYAAGDLMEVSALDGGSSAYMLLASGENIAYGDQLESKGDGTLRAKASGTPLFVALEAVNNTNGNAGPTNPPAETGGTSALPTGAARIRVEVF